MTACAPRARTWTRSARTPSGAARTETRSTSFSSTRTRPAQTTSVTVAGGLTQTAQLFRFTGTTRLAAAGTATPVAGSLTLALPARSATLAVVALPPVVRPPPAATSFYTLPPCRVLDTRNPAGPLGGPALQPGATRTFDAVGSTCGVPATAKALSVNLTVTGPVGPGQLTLYPGDEVSAPLASSINFRAGQTRANNAILLLALDSSGFKVLNGSAGTVHFILDVNGYFQ